MPSNNYQQNIVLRRTPPSLQSLAEGQIVFAVVPNEGLNMYTKQAGQLFKTKFSKQTEGIVFNEVEVKRKMMAREIGYTGKFTDYRFFHHNFYLDIGTTEYYFPWYDGKSGVAVDMNTSATAFLAPYAMTLHKLFVRPDGLTDTSGSGVETNDLNLTFALDKQDDGDTTVDSIATFTYTTLLRNESVITINRSDWSSDPSVEAGDKIGISIDADADPSSSAIPWYITSVWEVEIIV